MTNTNRRRSAPRAAAATPTPATSEQTEDLSPVETKENPERDAPDGKTEPGPDTGYVSPREAFVALLSDIGRTSEISYGDMVNAIRQSGWFVQLRQTKAESHASGGVLISFALLFGTSPSRLEVADEITMLVPYVAERPILDPSIWARANSYPSVVMALFNILPPAAAQQERPAADDPGTPVNTQRDEREDNVNDDEPLDMLEKRTPDGLPIYYDPYNIAESAPDIGESILASMQNELMNISSLEGLATIYSLNSDAFEFVKEMTPGIYSNLIDLLNVRRDELTPPDEAPRRNGRSPARR